MLTSLDHVVIAVADLEAATATYCRLYGREASWRGEHPAFGTANTLFRLRNTYVELLAAAGDGPVADLVRERVATAGEGPMAIALGTADAQTTAAELRARGMACSEPVAGSGRDLATGAERRWRSAWLPADTTRGVSLFVIEHLTPADVLRHAPLRDGVAETAAVSGIDHVVILGGDADAVIALYRDALGLRLALDRTFEERRMRLLFFRVGGITVECAVALGAGALGAEADRLWGVSYRTDDVAAARARLAADGFDVSEVRTGMKAGTRVCTVRREMHGVATLLLGVEPS